MLNPQRIGLFIAACTLITISFYNDRLGLIDDKFYTYYQQSFEFMVVGRLAMSQQDGAFSAGGLLVAVDADTYDITNKSIKHQYDTYTQGKTFGRYWTYKSTPGIEGIVYSLADQFTNFPASLNLRLFRASAALAAASILSLLLIWLEFEFGVLAFALSLLFILISPWLVLLGPNMYWQMWSFFLPFVSVLLLLERFSRKAVYPSKWILLTVFITILLKVLFSGFEFITTVLVSGTIPLVYFSIRDKWGMRFFVRRIIAISLTAILAAVTGLVILLFQIQAQLGGVSAGYQYILDAFLRRSAGNPEDFTGIFADAMESSVWSVVNTYMKGPAYVFDGTFAGGASEGIPYIVVILTFSFFSLIAAVLMMKSGDPSFRRKALALLGMTWFSILAPLSWFVVFKAHAYIHLNLDYFIWQVPFTILGFALTGWTISQLFGFLKAARVS